MTSQSTSSLKPIVHMVGFGHAACGKDMPPVNWEKGHVWSNKWEDVTCPECRLGKEPIDTYKLGEDGKSITCLHCGRTSHNRNDVAKRYCGACGAFHDDIWPPARAWWIRTGPRALQTEASGAVTKGFACPVCKGSGICYGESCATCEGRGSI